MPHDSLPTSAFTTRVERVRTFETRLTFPCITRNGGAIKITLWEVHAGHSGRPMELVIETMEGAPYDGWADVYLGEREASAGLSGVSQNLSAAEARPVSVCLGSQVDSPLSVPPTSFQRHEFSGASGLTRLVVDGEPVRSPATD